MKIISVRGIGEPLFSPIIGSVVRHLNRITGEQQRVTSLPWKAEYGPVPNPLGSSFKDSLESGKRLLLQELEKEPALVIGYSGGAKLAGDVAVSKPKNMVALGLIADPAMPMGVVRTRTRAWGITGQRPIDGVPVMWKADPKDGICSCPPNSPLRTLADQSQAFSLADPAGWSNDVFQRLLRGAWQEVNLGQQFTQGEWFKAIELFKGYAFGGDHISYGLRREHNGLTYTENLAHWLAQYT